VVGAEDDEVFIPEGGKQQFSDSGEVVGHGGSARGMNQEIHRPSCSDCITNMPAGQLQITYSMSVKHRHLRPITKVQKQIPVTPRYSRPKTAFWT
jgi:hypothetical protein